MKKQRPYNLNLLTIRFPVPAIISILHRVSGVIVFFLIPLLLWMLKQSLASADNYIDLVDILANPFFKFIFWGFLAALLFHLVAGIRHLIMDLGFGESLKAGRASAWTVAIVSVVLIIVTGVWLWAVV